MNSGKPLSVEIFSDIDGGYTDIERVFVGVNIVNAVAKNLDIIKSSRMLRLSSDTKDYIDTEKSIRWPRFGANLNIVVTNRELHADNENEDDPYDGKGTLSAQLLGRAWSPILSEGQRVALVTTAGEHEVELTVAHELGHLLGLKADGRRHDTKAHCLEEECLMYPTRKVMHYEESSMMSAPKRWFVPRRAKNNVSITEKAKAVKFCDECSDQLGQYAFFLSMAKAGEFVLDSLLPHGTA